MSGQIPDLTGRTFVVTGANSGLGFETSRALAGRGARVIMAVRDLAKGDAAVERLRRDQPTADVQRRQLDLSDLDSVHRFADLLIADGTGVDVLVNNAGVMMTPRTQTAQGFELQFGVNHLGHFALTGLLLRVLRRGKHPRVVTVSSEMHRFGRGDFEDAVAPRRYRPARAYAESKLANVVFGLELDRRMATGDHAVHSVLAHPGYADTNLQRTGPTGLVRRVLVAANRIAAQDATSGARSQLHAATAAGATGQYFGPAVVARGRPRPQQPARIARDPDRARHLWQLSEQLTGVSVS